ncbi:type II secretion system protein [Brockia lithotrophica]|uniref:Type IV pilus assembly protein PilA n=1 Tax=Brockia lithotrophica TaxID=933949 RepID=A0A660L0F0_9BACL|nr:prepilin-type N-terminal cleavage/methylation domain-containing protein [Brockia lithotrophica]RKQ84720.1 type IV pilus assembly protein PilA [Brockia lithotrophica]
MLLRAACVRPAVPNAQENRRLRRKDGGFTLLELLAVLVILAVIIAIAVPLIGNIIERSKQEATINTAGQIAEAARLYIISEENGQLANKTVDVATLVNSGYLTQPYDGWGAKIEGTSSVEFGANGDLKQVTLISDKLGNNPGKVLTADQIRQKKWE